MKRVGLTTTRKSFVGPTKMSEREKIPTFFRENATCLGICLPLEKSCAKTIVGK